MKRKVVFVATLLCSLNAALAQSWLETDADIVANKKKLSQMSKPSGSDTATFRAEGLPSLAFSQAQYSESWKDGKNSLGIRAAFSGSATYTKNRIFLKNSLDMAYAKSKEGDATRFTKKEDRLNFNSSFGYEITSGSLLYWVAQVDLKTQFDKGYNADGATISQFFAPAYIIGSLGARYQSGFGLSAVLSPVSGRFTVVSDTTYCRYIDADLAEKPRHFRAQVGAYAQVSYEKNISKHVSVKSTLEFFSNYQHSPQNIDMDWITSASFHFNSWLSVIFFNRAIYRDLDRYQVKTTDNGVETLQTRGPRVQWTESLNVGLAYKLSTK